MIDIINFLINNNISFEQNVDLRTKTWIHRGGLCALYIQPVSADQLEILVQFLYQASKKFYVVGHTSNLYIHNDANVDIIVSTRKCNKYEIREDEIYCECGVGVIKLAKDCVNKGIVGFEFLTGLPGTVAGALYNNSSCKSNSISELLLDMRLVKDDGETLSLKSVDMNYEFRSSNLKNKRLFGTIISCRLQVKKTNAKELLKISSANEEERKRILEGPSQNLGCTVNRCFINGSMPLKYRIPFAALSKLLSLFHLSKDVNYEIKKIFVLFISGYMDLAPYISNKQIIIFVWRDDGADKLFRKYLEFMKKVYKTDKIEIEEIINEFPLHIQNS